MCDLTDVRRRPRRKSSVIAKKSVEEYRPGSIQDAKCRTPLAFDCFWALRNFRISKRGKVTSGPVVCVKSTDRAPNVMLHYRSDFAKLPPLCTCLYTFPGSLPLPNGRRATVLHRSPSRGNCSSPPSSTRKEVPATTAQLHFLRLLGDIFRTNKKLRFHTKQA